MVMVEVNPDGKDAYTMDAWLLKQLDFAKNCQKHNWDILMIITSGGKPGPGKSTLASQICKYMDPEFSLDQCVFTGDDLVKTGLGMKRKGFAIQYDEAKEALNKRRQMTKYFYDIDMFLDECRQFRPFLCMVTPNLFDLPKQLVINRASGVIDVFYKYDKVRNSRKRGYFRFYGDQSSRWLYLKGLKTENYKAAFPDLKEGSFNKHMTYDGAAYDEKKLQAARSRRDNPVSGIRGEISIVKTGELINNLHELEKYSYPALADLGGYTERQLYNIVRRFKEEVKVNPELSESSVLPEKTDNIMESSRQGVDIKPTTLWNHPDKE